MKVTLILLLFVVPGQLFSYSVNDIEQLMQKSKYFYENSVTTYYSFTILQEKHGSKLRGKERVRLFFKKPNNQYYQFMKGKFEGLRASYMPNRDGKEHFLAKETGFRGMLGVKSWGFDSIIKKVLYPHVYDVNQYHIGFIIYEGLRLYNLAKKKGTVAIIFAGDVYDKLLKKKMFKITFQLSDNPKDGFPYYRADYFIDKKNSLPLHVVLYDFDGSIKAYYSFVTMKLNPVISDSIFDLHNDPPKPLLPDPKFDD